jgi:restriction endonuclease S subunit
MKNFVTLGEICDLHNGFAFKSDDYIDHSNTLNCRMSNIRPDGTFDIEYAPKYLPDSYANKFSSYLLHDGDLVIAMTDMASDPKILGVPTIVKTNGKNLLLNQRVGKLIITKKNEVHLSYLQYALNRTSVKKYYTKFAGGGLQLNVGKKEILSLKIPLPPLEQQIRIAKILDTADALRQKDKELLVVYDELLQATFLDMFGDPVLNPKRWKMVKLGEITEKIQIGPFGSQLHRSDYIPDGVPLINPTNIKGDTILYDNIVRISEELYNSMPQYHLKEKDIIMARRGDLSKVGLITSSSSMLFCGTGSLFIRLSKSFNEIFIHYLLSDKSTTKYLENEARGVTMLNLNKGIIKQIPIYLPPIELQIQFAQIVTNIEAQKVLAKQNLLQSEEMFNAMVQKAFNGEI